MGDIWCYTSVTTASPAVTARVLDARQTTAITPTPTVVFLPNLIFVRAGNVKAASGNAGSGFRVSLGFGIGLGIVLGVLFMF